MAWKNEEEMGAVFVPSTYQRFGNLYELPLCLFNINVDCKEKDKCKTCGWNPAVDDARKKKRREKL